ncbi:MOZ/SAS family protein [Tritrichomonas foetus]|uniref:Histone acetyltransferase n=1 Tax=Tritrichomonas foetus TaxID=1144522 RepID=A0A1J4KE20_9EUKA|nr:MOZ/SAS family protein [Tritrichomonas foetus]|eukprot:OHT07964.1 MOZ/SAS family protein [Tritrichomonas foetus]
MESTDETETGTFKLQDHVSVFCDEYEEMREATILTFRENDTQAYIHFEHEDKRLDRWVDVSKLQPFVSTSQPSTPARVLSRRDHERLHNSSDDEQLSAEVQRFENIHREVTKIRNIEQITISNFTIRTWYFSPYPHPFYESPHLFICDHCCNYFATQEQLDEHLRKTNEKHPPGREIYRKGNVSIFELHGCKQKLACQCLCLLAKLFLDHKTLFYDVEGFLFYVLCECDENGAHVAAYFSREIVSDEGNILACIVALPPYQKRGYGRLLISLSYEIAKRQHRSGGPERPLSDLGKIAFHAYWRDTLVETLKTHGRDISTLDDLVRLTSISRDDIIDVLREMNCVSKGKGEYELYIQKESLQAAIQHLEDGKPRQKIDPNALIWLDGDDDKVDFTPRD